VTARQAPSAGSSWSLFVRGAALSVGGSRSVTDDEVACGEQAGAAEPPGVERSRPPPLMAENRGAKER
jgi:hypothetical protein